MPNPPKFIGKERQYSIYNSVVSERLRLLYVGITCKKIAYFMEFGTFRTGTGSFGNKISAGMFRGKKEMKLISQSQIRDFQTCPQKYYLSHILKLSWPAPPSPLFKKLEEEAALGETFHLFVHRIIQGLNPEESAFETENKTIAKWIDNFLRNYPLPQDAVLYSERELTNLDEDILWIGKFDVIATLQNKILIFDWKTSQKAGKVLWLEESPQTRLYRYLLYQNRQLYSYDGIGSYETRTNRNDLLVC